LDETSLKFLTIKTIDGYVTEAALWLPTRKEAAESTLVVMIHGSGGSYRRAPESALGPRLAACGHAALAIDTRQHDDRRRPFHQQFRPALFADDAPCLVK
jgi:hypothetical protein